jgi:hypothetical protein
VRQQRDELVSPLCLRVTLHCVTSSRSGVGPQLIPGRWGVTLVSSSKGRVATHCIRTRNNAADCSSFLWDSTTTQHKSASFRPLILDTAVGCTTPWGCAWLVPRTLLTAGARQHRSVDHLSPAQHLLAVGRCVRNSLEPPKTSRYPSCWSTRINRGCIRCSCGC